ncbi:MAG: peptidyl-prolyl cis-trans isomerase [Planctomycetaceae bacterium]|nr:peptidyl-prolyl cis-trans isomerase [Planctomycetaceae bacterium]
MRKFIDIVFLSILIINTSAFAFLFGETKKESRPVAATVNGAKIYEDTLVKIAKHRYEEAVKQKSSSALQDIRKDVISDMIFTEVVLQKGRKNFLLVDNDEVQFQISKSEEGPYEELKKNKDYKGDFEELERHTRAGMLYVKLLTKECTKNINPTEEQMKKYYEDNIRNFQIETKYSYIPICFVPDKESNDPNFTKLKCKERAESVLEKIHNGADFNEMYIPEAEAIARRMLAKHRIKPHDPNQLISKNFVRTKRDVELSPETKDVLLSLKPGQVSNVITCKDYDGETYFTIFKLISKKEGYTQKYDEVKDRLREYVSNELQEIAVNNYNQKLITEADIKFTNSADDYRLQDKKEVNKPNIKK